MQFNGYKKQQNIRPNLISDIGKLTNIFTNTDYYYTSSYKQWFVFFDSVIKYTYSKPA